jgi:oligopeptide transport system substrate-binding protein
MKSARPSCDGIQNLGCPLRPSNREKNMKLRTTFLASTAILAFAMGAPVYAESHVMAGDVLAAPELQTFTSRELDEFPSIDPSLIQDVAGNDVARQLFEGLMNQAADGTLLPGVATGYTVSDDKMTYTFNLRPEAKWSNGDPVKASDFVFAWRRTADPATASEYSWYLSLASIENVDAVIDGSMTPDQLGVSAPDDHTLVVKLTQPLPYFPQMVVNSSLFPQPEAVVTALGDAWTQPGNMVSNGAYVLTERVQQEKLVMERNPMYWDDANTIINKVTYLIINDENQALTRYLAGELDKTEIPTGQYPRLKEEYPDQAMSVPLLCSYYYALNLSDTGPEALKDVRVRQALSLAVNRDIIVDNVLQGGQKPAYTFTHWATAGFETPTVEAATMTQDERNAKAVELMSEAGYGTGGEPLTLDLLYNTSEAHKSIAVAISQMWKQTLGVEVNLSNEEWQTFLDDRGNQRYQVARAGWCGDYDEASTFTDLMTSTSGYNDSKYNNPEVDALAADAKTAQDPQADYTKIEEIIAVDVPIIPIYHYSANKMLNANIRNWPVNNVQQNYYVKDLYRVE